MNIRKSTLDDYNTILEIYSYARNFMSEHNNPNQWGTNRPTKEEVKNDIINGKSYVCVEDDCIVAVFYFSFGEDDTYVKIHNGNWLNEKDYAVVHRIASSGKVKGAGSFCLNWAFQQCGNLKIDTHKDNIIMQRALEKNGFKYCGTIYLNNGDQRMAYQKEN